MSCPCGNPHRQTPQQIPQAHPQTISQHHLLTCNLHIRRNCASPNTIPIPTPYRYYCCPAPRRTPPHVHTAPTSTPARPAPSVQVGVSVPLVVRLEGTNVTRGKEILRTSGMAIIAADDLDDAAKKAVASLGRA